MEVILKIGTKQDPGDKVIVKSDVQFTTVEALDRWLDAQKTARNWLAKQIARR